jgi:glycosyltransferase involved in cell wall biosynthesis
MNNNKLVSVFLPYYNDKKYIYDTIQSILLQTYQNFELILFNHASTDGSREIARSFTDKRIIHIDAEKNLGAGSGLNLLNSLPLITGEYLKLFCADDIMELDCLKELVSYLETNPEKDFVFSDTAFIDEYNNKSKETWFNQRACTGLSFDCDEKEMLRLLFIRYSPLCYPSSLLKTKVIFEIELDKTSILLFDVHLWASLLIIGKKIGLINKPLIAYRVHEEQVSYDGILFSGSAEYEKLNNHLNLSFFEVITIQDIFYNIKDISLVKYLCKNSPFTPKLNDINLIPFVISHYYLKIFDYPNEFASFHTAIYLNGYIKMFNLMNDDKLRKNIEETFGFGIKEFRELYNNKNILSKINNEFNYKNIESQLSSITNSRTWRYGNKIAIFIRKIFPKGSKRAAIAGKLERKFLKSEFYNHED